MTESNLNPIQPVGLPNVSGVGRSGDQKKQKKQSPSGYQQTQDDDRRLEEELMASIEDQLNRERVNDDPDEHIIDYCA